MKDEHREKLNNRLTPIHLYKLTPKTNCGECRFATCLAFATQVIVGQADLDACPYLDQEAVEPVRRHLAEQHRSGIGVKREGFEKALEFLRKEILRWNFRTIAESLGAEYAEPEGVPALRFPFFGRPVTVTHGDVSRDPHGPDGSPNSAGSGHPGSSPDSGEDLNPYEKILLFNYVIGGAVELSGVWVGMESLPNSVSKIKSLKAHCEDRIARTFAGKVSRLPEVLKGLGRPVSLDDEKVDFAAQFQILPKLEVRVLWWDEDPSEGFEAKTKLLFDSRVLQVLDLESLLFACEQLTDRLLEPSVTGRL
jgi:hypothetical protein